MIGWAVRQLAIWGGAALLFYAFIGYRLAPTASQNQPPAAAPHAAPGHGAAPNALVFDADRRGHVMVDAIVNGAPVRFLVDTGATMVVLTPRDAAAAGFGPADLTFSGRASTANGVIRTAPVTLREVRINQLAVPDVSASVAENLNISLLGQSFLTRLDSYQMRDGRLTLTYW